MCEEAAAAARAPAPASIALATFPSKEEAEGATTSNRIREMPIMIMDEYDTCVELIT
jgi:hypothetical protein